MILISYLCSPQMKRLKYSFNKTTMSLYTN